MTEDPARRYETIELYRTGAAAKVVLNRPERMNAWSNALSRDLLEVLGDLAADDAVRAVMLTGAGRAFCSGADLKEGAQSAAGGAVGAPLRYLTDRAVQARHDSVFPWGTFTVNVAGSLILGVLTGAALSGAAGHTVQLLLGTGLCGALTTYSTFSYETRRLVEDGAASFAVANVAGSVAAGLGAAFAGFALAGALFT